MKWVLVSAGAAATALTLSACGGGDGEAKGGPLAWEKPPRLLVQAALPRDRILVGILKNDSLRPVGIPAKSIRVKLDGRRLKSSAIFTDAYLHGLFPPTREPTRIPSAELQRTGRELSLKPGQTRPFTVSWRLPAGADERRVRVEYPGGTLPVPRERTTGGG